MAASSHQQQFHRPERHIAVVGDSIAAGYELPPAYAWPNLLVRSLIETWPHFNWRLDNASMPGDATPDAYIRFDDILGRRPDIVLIALGINDCRRASSPAVERRIAYFWRNEQTWWGKNPLLRRIGNRLNPPGRVKSRRPSASQVPLDDFLAILSWMVRQAQIIKALPALLTMSPLAPFLAESPAFAACARYNAVIRDIARETGTALIEITHQMPPNIWQTDGVHLTALGQAELAQCVFHHFSRPAIASYLGLEIPASNANMAPSLD